MVIGNYGQFCWYQTVEKITVGCDNNIMVMEENVLTF